jgi:four helix bundle protein
MENKPYNLEERTLEFGKRIIRLAKTLERNTTNKVLVSQIVRSGTSLGSNYREANETETKKDFTYRIRICRKEAKETLYWLKIIVEANPILRRRIEPLIQETSELKKIFAAIALKSK